MARKYNNKLTGPASGSLADEFSVASGGYGILSSSGGGRIKELFVVASSLNEC
jgi:hypothetical protein